MKRIVCGVLMVVCGVAVAQEPQQSQEAAPTIRVTSNLVEVPTMVELKGQLIYGLKADQFRVEDNGVVQKIRLDEEADVRGVSMVVLMQCSREAVMQFGNMRGVPAMVEGLVGAAPKEIAVVRYGSGPEMLQDFTHSLTKAVNTLSSIKPCEDGEAATVDAVHYAASLLSDREAGNRRVILLIGETRDHGSKTKPEVVIHELGQSNVVVDAVSFNPGKTEILDSLLHGQWGPGPLGLIMMAVNAMKKNAPKTMAQLSGGDYINFTTQKGFDQGMQLLTNHVHNYYMLSFQSPSQAVEGLHVLKVTVPLYPNATIRSRESYWAEKAAQ